MSSLPCELLWNQQIYEGLRDASGLTLMAASNILCRSGTPGGRDRLTPTSCGVPDCHLASYSRICHVKCICAMLESSYG